MSTQHTEVTSTHWSAMFGSKESVSVGVSGEEEPASCIWHNSSSVMMSNTMSSGGLQSAFAPGPWRRVGREEKHARLCPVWLARTAPLKSTRERSIRWHVPEEPRRGLEVKWTVHLKRLLLSPSVRAERGSEFLHSLRGALFGGAGITLSEPHQNRTQQNRKRTSVLLNP